LEHVAHGRAKVADKVMLSRQHIKTKRPTEMLDHKLFCPFLVKWKVGQRAYELELPAKMNVHPVFYVGLLDISKKVKKLVLPSGSPCTTLVHCGLP
jgi:hypothetical protein